MALIAASVIEPGAYFAMNAPPAAIGTTVQSSRRHHFRLGLRHHADALTTIAHQVGETTILARAGGAPTLAVGMAHIFSGVIGGPALMAFWYHFAILFEALFILTTIDAGTRVARFMIQDFAGLLVPAWPHRKLGRQRRRHRHSPSSPGAISSTRASRILSGGINTLWPLFGIANQMLAAIALTFCTVVLFKMKRQRYAWVAAMPTAWLAICTLTAGWEKIFSPNPRHRLSRPTPRATPMPPRARATCSRPPKPPSAMHQIIANDTIDVTLTAAFMAVVLTMLGAGALLVLARLRRPTRDHLGRTRMICTCFGKTLDLSLVRATGARPCWACRITTPTSRMSRALHPEREALSREDFFRERQAARFGSVLRCC